MKLTVSHAPHVQTTTLIASLVLPVTLMVTASLAPVVVTLTQHARLSQSVQIA
jgi:hypothetical protein